MLDSYSACGELIESTPKYLNSSQAYQVSIVSSK